LRSCFFLGIKNIFVDDFSKCPLTPTVSKTSAGALELLEIIKIK
jgi:21S rRNA (GM2251-2'-O)-methyltransferase